MVVAH